MVLNLETAFVQLITESMATNSTYHHMGHFPKCCQISRFMVFVRNVRYLALWHFGCMKWVICN